MKYPKNDLWSVRQIEFLEDALDGYEGKSVIYYADKKLEVEIPGIEKYEYEGVLHFPDNDRTIILEQGTNYGLKKVEVLDFLENKNIRAELH